MHLDLTSLVDARSTNDIMHHCRRFRSVNPRQTRSIDTDKVKLAAGEDVGHYGGSYKVTYDLYKKYGDMRLLDTPICGRDSHYLVNSINPATNFRGGLILPCLPGKMMVGLLWAYMTESQFLLDRIPHSLLTQCLSS